MAASVAMALAQAKGEASDGVARICCVAHRGQQRLLVLARVTQETPGDTPATQAANSASASVSGWACTLWHCWAAPSRWYWVPLRRMVSACCHHQAAAGATAAVSGLAMWVGMQMRPICCFV